VRRMKDWDEEGVRWLQTTGETKGLRGYIR
jgi:hypothetical protein